MVEHLSKDEKADLRRKLQQRLFGTKRLYRPRIAQTRYGNWYGYGLDGKLAEAFSNPVAGTGAEEVANEWLAGMMTLYEQEKSARLLKRLGETFKPYAIVGKQEIISYPWLQGTKVYVNVRAKIGDPTSMNTMEIKRGKLARLRWLKG